MKTLRNCFLVFIFVFLPVFAHADQVDQSSLRQLIQLLQQEVTLLTQQLQILLDQQIVQPKVTVSSAITVPDVASSPIVSSCIENPILTLSSTSDAVKYDPQEKPRYTVHGSYSTGCPLDLKTEYVYKADPWRSGSGIFGIREATVFNGLGVNGDIVDPNYLTWNFYASSIPAEDNFIITIGSTTSILKNQ